MGSIRLEPRTTRGRRLRHPQSGDLAAGRTALAPASAARERTTETSHPKHPKQKQHEAGRKPRFPARAVPLPSERDRRSRELLDDEVDELARDDDRLARLAAVQVAPHALALARTRYELVLAQACVHLEPVAHLAVDLDDELERLPHELRLVGLRPRPLPEALVTQH